MSGMELDFPAPAVEHRTDGVMIVNDSGAPDAEVLAAVREVMTDTHFVESAGLTQPPSAFQVYAGEGNVLARKHWQAPTNVIDEVKLARELIDTDDTCANVLGQLLAAAFKGRMRHLHEDEKTEVLFGELGKRMRLINVLREMYRELLIASSVTTVAGFTTEELSFNLDGVDRRINQSVVGPRIGVMPAEYVRVKGSDIMGMGVLCYKPSSWQEEEFLERFFSPTLDEAERRVMRQQNPFLTTMLVERLEEDADTRGPFADILDIAVGGKYIYRFNPRMVHRTCFPKGAAKYPRPLLTGNFALLEAKRLLNIMDYALLQGGSNYIVVAKKGSDQRPAKPNEVLQLAKTVKTAGKTGVIVGDHRLSIEILTPDLEALLNPEKRDMIDRKLALRLMRMADLDTGETSEGSKNSMEFLQAVITTDREMLVRHIEDFIYEEVVARNGRTFAKGAADIWMPPVILAGLDLFLQGILKLRDRGDIPRAYGVEFFGYDMRAAVRERKREAARGDDDVMLPTNVPHDSPANGAGGQRQLDRPDNGGGRPRGAGDRQQRARPGAEPIRAILDEGTNDVVRIGATTYAILEQHVETKRSGRLSSNERALLEEGGGARAGVTVVPVNDRYDVGPTRLVRLTTDVAMVVGRRTSDRALVAKALIFNHEYSDLDIRETALRWGFELPEPEEEE